MFELRDHQISRSDLDSTGSIGEELMAIRALIMRLYALRLCGSRDNGDISQVVSGLFDSLMGAGDLLAAIEAVYDLVIGTFRGAGSGNDVLRDCSGRIVNMLGRSGFGGLRCLGGLGCLSRLGSLGGLRLIANMDAILEVIGVHADLSYVIRPAGGTVRILGIVAEAFFVLYAVAAVAVVNIPVCAAGLLLGEGVDGVLVGVDDIDTVIKAPRIGRAVGSRIIIVGVSALDVGVFGLSRLIIDGLGCVGAAVNTVVEDRNRNGSGVVVGIVGDVGIVDALLIILDLHAVAYPMAVLVSRSAPPIDAGIVLAVENVKVIIPCGRLFALFEHEIIVRFLDDFVGHFILHFGNVHINVVGRDGTVLTVRHHEIDALGLDRAGLHLIFRFIRRNTLTDRHNRGDAVFDVRYG